MTCFPSILELCHPFCENILIVITFYIRLSSLFTYSITIVVLFSLLAVTSLTFIINGWFRSVCQPGFWTIFSGTSLNSSCLHTLHTIFNFSWLHLPQNCHFKSPALSFFAWLTLNWPSLSQSLKIFVCSNFLARFYAIFIVSIKQLLVLLKIGLFS